MGRPLRMALSDRHRGREERGSEDKEPSEVPDECTGYAPTDFQQALPKEPPHAPTTFPMMRNHGAQPYAAMALAQQAHVSKKIDLGKLNLGGDATSMVTNEEEEWLLRQRISGVICRMVKYVDGDSPAEDIVGLRCSRRGRIMVTAVREHGKAARAGVAAGDELKSIDGWKGFQDCPAHVIHRSLRAPATLIFVGFVGKLQAEVRVKQPVHRCGIPSDRDIMTAPVAGKACPSVRLCDEVVFKPRGSSLFIATKQTSSRRARDAAPQEADEKHAMYELRSDEARFVVHGALTLNSSPSLFSI